MIDEIKNLVPGKSALGIKWINENEWFLDCHLKDYVAMPGTLQIEAMLQTLVATIYTIPGRSKEIAFVNNISTQLIKKVGPGHELAIYAELVSNKRGIARGHAIGKVKDMVVCRGKFTFITMSEIPTPGSR